MLHAGEGADFPLGCLRAVADEQRRSDARRTAELQTNNSELHVHLRGTKLKTVG